MKYTLIWKGLGRSKFFSSYLALPKIWYWTKSDDPFTFFDEIYFLWKCWTLVPVVPEWGGPLNPCTGRWIGMERVWKGSGIHFAFYERILSERNIQNFNSLWVRYQIDRVDIINFFQSWSKADNFSMRFFLKLLTFLFGKSGLISRITDVRFKKFRQNQMPHRSTTVSTPNVLKPISFKGLSPLFRWGFLSTSNDIYSLDKNVRLKRDDYIKDF